MHSTTRCFGTQCDSKRSTGMQTKRLSKDEIRYFTKVIEKEKEVLLRFMDVTRGATVLQRYHVNAAPVGMQASSHKGKVPKNCGARKKGKRRNKRKHSVKAVHQVEKVENGEGRAHYVSKIVVDDNARSLKLSLKSCQPRKASSENEFKENEQSMECKERVRSRKAKRPRRVCRVLKQELSTTPERRMETTSPAPRALPPKKGQAANFAVKPEPNEKSDCMFSANNRNRDKSTNAFTTCTSSEDGNKVNAAAEVATEEKKTDTLLTTTNRNGSLADDQFTTSPYSEEEMFNSVSASDDDEQLSDCSEEFSLIEPSEAKAEVNKAEVNKTEVNKTEVNKAEVNKSEVNKAMEIAESISPHNTQEATKSVGDEVVRNDAQSTNVSMRSELKKRLKANLIRKQIDSQCKTDHKDRELNMANRRGSFTADESNALPQVVSVHFYDPQNQCQRIIDPNTHITQYAARDGTHVMLNKPTSPQTSLTPPLCSPSVTTPPTSFPNLSHTPSSAGSHLPQARPQTSPTNASPTRFRFTEYHGYTDGIRKQSPTVTTYSSGVNNHPGTTTAATGYHSSYSTQTIPASIPASPEVGKLPPTVSTNSHPASTVGKSDAVDTASGDAGNNEDPKTSDDSEPRGTKRKRFIFGSHEAPRKKVISSLLTPLCEREAIRLADGIHDINMQYFPLRSLAQKAACRVSTDTDDVLKLIDQKIQLKTKVQDVEKARNLLKDIYDMVLKSKEIEDIQNFELVSHNFGVRNILNHLSLVDLYFGELGSELQSKI